MRTEISRLLQMKKFFNIIESKDNKIKYTLEKPSRILMQNIRLNWLRSVLVKTQKNFPVFLSERLTSKQNEIPYGYISQRVSKCDKNSALEQNVTEEASRGDQELKLNLIVPENCVMQYFIQWQRYRKYWWSSITTTPSLFSVDDIKYEEGTANANIVAKFKQGPLIVETVSIHYTNTEAKNTSRLICKLPLDEALFILLLDGLSNCTKEKYLRLHRTMAPFKMSYALEGSNSSASGATLEELANLLHLRLEAKSISSLLPDFSLPMENQIKENLELGVPYTAILNEKTLQDGIFHLKNSCTMLKEMVHVADFDTYAALICNK